MAHLPTQNMILTQPKTQLLYAKTDPLTAFFINWQRFWHLYRLWWRAEDLEHLMRWAARKGLKHRDYYEHLWLETQTRLLRRQLHTPGLGRWAYRLYTLAAFLTPAPRYHARGSASRYRRQPYRLHAA
ncbi:MAG: hypothetical protein KJ064_17770 [Anaerolineae bacterium]|nr:hypothetical protein [Anaerolineae bacterium]